MYSFGNRGNFASPPQLHSSLGLGSWLSECGRRRHCIQNSDRRLLLLVLTTYRFFSIDLVTLVCLDLHQSTRDPIFLPGSTVDFNFDQSQVLICRQTMYVQTHYYNTTCPLCPCLQNGITNLVDERIDLNGWRLWKVPFVGNDQSRNRGTGRYCNPHVYKSSSIFLTHAAAVPRKYPTLSIKWTECTA